MPKPKRNRALNVIDGRIAILRNDLAVAKAQVDSLQAALANQEATRAAVEKAYQRQPVVKPPKTSRQTLPKTPENEVMSVET